MVLLSQDFHSIQTLRQKLVYLFIFLKTKVLLQNRRVPAVNQQHISEALTGESVKGDIREGRNGH